jgi:hypothetical protein
VSCLSAISFTLGTDNPLLLQNGTAVSVPITHTQFAISFSSSFSVPFPTLFHVSNSLFKDYYEACYNFNECQQHTSSPSACFIVIHHYVFLVLKGRSEITFLTTHAMTWKSSGETVTVYHEPHIDRTTVCTQWCYSLECVTNFFGNTNSEYHQLTSVFALLCSLANIINNGLVSVSL